jgi:hypothetical protein
MKFKIYSEGAFSAGLPLRLRRRLSVLQLSLKEYAFQEAERNALNRLQTTKKNLSAFFSENIKPARILAGMQPWWMC